MNTSEVETIAALRISLNFFWSSHLSACLYNVLMLSIHLCSYIAFFLKDDMVSTPEGSTDNSPIFPMTSTPIKKPSAQKSLCMFINVLDVKKELLTVELELLNLSARQLNLEIHHGH